MQAIGMRAALRRIADFGRDRKACLYRAVCVVLLVVAAGLRFHDLSEHYLWSDEATTAYNSSGTLSEVVTATRYGNSSPILPPLVLYAVQQVESTIFSVRIVPATASVLTVAAMLFLLPRLGVAPGAAFLAALLATFSVEQIRHAQDAREYSIDALLAVLMLAGLLRYLRDGRKVLFCVSLFLAPLLQYGLVLFGVAVIGAAAVAPCVSERERRSACPGRIGDWLKRRLGLVAPCGFFLAGGAVSGLVTLRYQWQAGEFGSDGYLSAYYYQGKFDARSILEFSIDGVGSLLTYHLPEIVTIAALPAFAVFLVVAFLGKFQGTFQANAIVVVFSFCIAVSVGAALLGIYPLGGIRQVIYLGPVIFLATGVAFHRAAGCLSSLTRRGWTMPALLVAIAGTTVFAGVNAMQQTNLYRPIDKGEEIVAVLQRRAQEKDVVYVSYLEVDGMYFHQRPEFGEVRINGQVFCGLLPQKYFREIITEIIPYAGAGRLWLVFRSPRHAPWNADPKVRSALGMDVSIEHVVSGGSPNLYLIEDTESLLKIAATTDILKDMKHILSRKLPTRFSFGIFLSEDEDMLTYVKTPCSAENVREAFFLHVYPVDPSDLPEHRKQYGFDNHDFRWASGCVAWSELPDYPIARIRTGQFLVNEDGSTTRLWGREIRFDE